MHLGAPQPTRFRSDCSCGVQCLPAPGGLSVHTNWGMCSGCRLLHPNQPFALFSKNSLCEYFPLLEKTESLCSQALPTHPSVWSIPSLLPSPPSAPSGLP